MENTYEAFKKEFNKLTGINLSFYKERQMKRRIDSFMQGRGYHDYVKFFVFLSANHEALDQFIEYTTINVSEFFRNSEQWEYLEKEIIPKLSGHTKIRIWSAACSTGDEPYTLAMLFLKYFPRTKFSILATDIDEKAIETAKKGIYSKKSIANVPKEYQQYFTKTENGRYAIAPEIRRCVNFKKHNLFSDEYPVNVNLLVCRNVLIYFTEEKKDEIFREYYKSLTRGGVLFLGNTEQVVNYKDIGYTRIASFFYEK